jgi:glycosyltransferase involved in cell wall biosynthesis
VIASTASSLPEVVGQAGLLVEPADVQALASAMVRVLADPALQAQMEMAGLEQARRFSWSHAARLTSNSYREALAAGGEMRRV